MNFFNRRQAVHFKAPLNRSELIAEYYTFRELVDPAPALPPRAEDFINQLRFRGLDQENSDHWIDLRPIHLYEMHPE